MTQPADMVKMTVEFDLQNGSDVVLDHAQFRIWSDAPVPVSDWDAWLQDVANFARDHWISGMPKTPFSPAVVLNRVVCGRYDTSGHVVNEKAAAASPTDWIGSGAKSLPWQVSLAISLYAYERGTFVLQGKSKRGRIYLPPLADSQIGDSTTGEMTLTAAETLRDAIGTWLTAIVGHTPTGGSTSFHPVVLSTTHNYSNEVAFLSVDTKLDTQRRREKQLTSVIGTVAWP